MTISSKYAANTIREDLLQKGFAHGALVYDLILSSGVANWNTYGIDSILGQIAVLGWNVGQSLVRKGLSELVKLGIMASKKIMLKTRGRPSLEYRLGTPEGIAKMLGVKLHRDEASDPIPPSAYESVTEFRKSLHRAYILRRPGKHSRIALGKRLGVSKRTTANYEKGSDIVVTQMEEKHPLERADIPLMPTKRQNGRFYMISEYERPMTNEEKESFYSWASPEWRTILKTPMKTITVILPLTRYLLRRELDRGHKVYKAWQTTNHYQIAGTSNNEGWGF